VNRLVYLLISNKPIRYRKGRSRIAYVGTTSKGIRRIAQSAAYRITQAFDKFRGSTRFDAHVVWTTTKRGPQTKKAAKIWKLLESAIIIRFRQIHGEAPKLNVHGKKLKPKNEFDVFRRVAIDNLIIGFGGVAP
jgi:hypothetical protein